jgi:Zn-dependent protease with chaperone function
MYNFIQKFHSGWAYLALLLLVLAVVNSVIGMTSKKEFTAKDRKIALFALIATHIQLVVGLILYFISEVGMKAFSTEGAMKIPELRLTMLEHPLTNIIAIALITIGWSKHKKGAANESKFKSITLFYGLGLVLILIRIPWKLWL